MNEQISSTSTAVTAQSAEGDIVTVEIDGSERLAVGITLANSDGDYQRAYFTREAGAKLAASLAKLLH